MVDNSFFNNFLKKDKMWQHIQNDPIARQDMWNNLQIKTIGYRVLDQNHQHSRRNINFVHNGFTLRMPAGRHNWRQTFYRDYPYFEKRNIAQKYDNIYMPDFVDPVPDYPNPIDDATRRTNSSGFRRYGFYKIRYVKTQRENADYWFPKWEGQFTQMNEKSKIKSPAPAYNTHFLPPKYMNDKQKEAFLWLVNGNAMYRI